MLKKSLVSIVLFSVLVFLVVELLGSCKSKDYTMSFKSIETPKTDEHKRINNSSPSVNINSKEYQINFHTLLRTGEPSPDGNGEYFALVKDAAGNALTQDDNPHNKRYKASEPWYCSQSSGIDHTSFITHKSKLFAITALECRIGGAYITELEQNPQTGILKALSTKPVSFSDVNGTYINCAGVTTPWNTHLGSEEYEPDMRAVDENDSKIKSIAKYNGYVATASNAKYLGYHMGWIPEIKVTDENGSTVVEKHFAMGRAAHELAYVMPDNKTLYLSDDGTNGGFYMFTADKAEDLSSGTLYAAKWIQNSSQNGGAATLNWLNLGHATNSEIKSLLDSNIEFADIFNYEEIKEDGTCSTYGFRAVNTSAGAECLQLISGQEKAASRFEKRRYGAYLGATTEFSKEEGITYNADDKKLYVVISDVRYGMEDSMKKGVPNNSYDLGGNNDIKLDYNKCGTIYALDVQLHKLDSAGRDINSKYVVGNMYTQLSGKAEAYSGELAKNECSLDGISYPDNITYLNRYGILIIGEDTSYHENDVIWAYNVKSKKLQRIFTSVYGAEITSPFWHTNINGFGYLSTVVQHPYGEDNQDMNRTKEDLNSYMGYIGPFPALD